MKKPKGSGMVESAKEALMGILSDGFSRVLMLFVLIAAAYSLAFLPTNAPIAPQQYGQVEGCAITQEVQFFYLPSCPHCKQQMPENQKIAEEYPCSKWSYYDVSENGNLLLLQAELSSRGQWSGRAQTPTTIINQSVFIGFDSEKTPQEIRAALSGSLLPAQKEKETISVPFLGSIKLSDYSLLALSVILGLIDGFNPCAMWVLIYLISITLTLNDRKRFLLVVGTFLLASGVLYFLIMSAWLNAFLFVGYLRPVMIAVGAFAVYWGIQSLREFINNRGKVVCEVGDIKERKRLRGKVNSLLSSPLTLATFAGIVILAFTVNSIEFVCSAAIPAVFTNVLSLRDIPALEHYAYIAIYVFFYMLDDIIVFALAYFAMGGSLGDKIASYGHAIGAAILIILGLLLLFAPGLLA